MYRLENGGMPKKKAGILSGSWNRISGSEPVRIDYNYNYCYCGGESASQFRTEHSRGRGIA